MNNTPHPNDHLFDVVNNEERGSYTVNKATVETIEPIKVLFPTGVADNKNVVIFSTDGTDGATTTIEEFEEAFRILRGNSNNTDITDDDIEEADATVSNGITYVILQPRIIKTYCGVCVPSSLEEIEYLKKLRDSSKEVLSKLG